MEVVECLGGQGEKLGDAGFAGFDFDELKELSSDALVFVGGTDVEIREFGLSMFRVDMKGHAGDRIAVDFVEVIVADLAFDFGAGAFDDLGAVDGFAGEEEELADVFFEGAPDLFVFVGVDEGADALVGEDFGEQGFILASVDDVDPGDSGAAGLGGVLGLGEEVRREVEALSEEEILEFAGEDLADEAASADQAVVAGDVDDFGGFEGFAEGDGDGIGVDPVRASLAVEAEGWDDGKNALAEEALEHFDVDAFDLSGEEVVDAAEDADGMGDDGVGGGGPEVVGGQAFEDFVGEAVGGGEGELEGGVVGDAGAVEVGRGGRGFDGELPDHGAGAVNEDDPDVEGTEDGDIQEDVREVLIHDDGGIDAEDEASFPKARDVSEDAAEIGRFHEWRRWGGGRAGREVVI